MFATDTTNTGQLCPIQVKFTADITARHAEAECSLSPGATPTGDLREHEVEGTTFNPDAGRVVGFKGMDANLEAIAAVCSLCTEAHLECSVRLSQLLRMAKYTRRQTSLREIINISMKFWYCTKKQHLIHPINVSIVKSTNMAALSSCQEGLDGATFCSAFLVSEVLLALHVGHTHAEYTYLV